MLATLPQWHGALVCLSAFGSVAFGAIILARNPRSASARLHFVYAAIVCGWLICLGNAASATTREEAIWWGRSAQVFIGAMIGIIYHLNVALAGLRREYRRRIQAHWVVAVIVAVAGTAVPGWVADAELHFWGYYPVYSRWGLITVGLLGVAVVEATAALRVSLARYDPRTAQHRKAGAFLRGNAFTCLAFVDFLPAFGVAVYPAGYIIISIMHAVTLYGSVRYRLIEITPEFAADHLLREIPDGVVVVDTSGMVRLANPSAVRLSGQTNLELMHRPLRDRSGHAAGLISVINQGAGGGPTAEVTVGPPGAERTLRLSGTRLLDQLKFPVADVWVLHDITEQRVAEAERERLEEGVRHRQKLESLGVMASGIAHDFNNLLVGIMGHAELARGKVSEPDAIKAHLAKIEGAAARASDLTDQLLTYTGKRHKQREHIHLNELIEEMAHLMRAAIAKNATLTLDLGPTLPPVDGDPSQLSQIIVNLIMNASDALAGETGTISLRTHMGIPDASYRHWGPADGGPVEEHVVLEVRDTGRGMDPDTLRQIFDPFFTTKFVGRGLGLATVLGIVRGHEGRTRVDSAPGRGTCFSIALPLASPGSEIDRVPTGGGQAWRGSGLALLVDDDPEVRTIAGEMLVDSGFRVIATSNGREALATFERWSKDISLILLDQTMPDVNGPEVYEGVRQKSREVPIVVMSGFSTASVVLSDRFTTFLPKPFSAKQLVARIQEVLDQDVGSAKAVM